MKTLIIPMMGKSIRFPHLKPKWAMTYPTGGFMGTAAIKGLDLEAFSNIYFVVRKEHQKMFGFERGFVDAFKRDGINVDIVLLDEETESQPETVYRCIKKMDVEGPILVKDSDNFFRAEVNCVSGNYICYSDLNDAASLNARNKSYIQFDNNGFVSNIVEKKVVSSTFSVGGYGFESARRFCKYYENYITTDDELYMSNVIYEMILRGLKFGGIKVSDYEDWGTIEDWNRFKETFKTLFVDLDGTLVTNTSAQIKPFTGKGAPLVDNIKCLQEMDPERTTIIIVTARPNTKKMRQITEEELAVFGIPYNVLMMGMPHCQRVVINDFADSNPYPACDAINIKRNSNDLRDYLT